MATGMQFLVSGNSMSARDLVLNVFHFNQWRITLNGDWHATAERGDAASSIIGGAFAGKDGRHVILQIMVSLDPQGYTVISLIETTSGISGGVIGMNQAKAVYQELYDCIGMALTNAGIFLGNTRIQT